MHGLENFVSRRQKKQSREFLFFLLKTSNAYKAASFIVAKEFSENS